MSTLWKIQLAVIVLAAAFSNSCSKAEPSPPTNPPAASAPASPKTASDNPTMRFLEERVKRDPDDFIANNKLAGEYMQRLRETGDITYLDLAARAASASLGTLPAEQNKGGLAMLVLVEYSSHDFGRARDHARRLIELDPNKGYPFQFLGDALLELGQYDEARDAFKQMQVLGGINALTIVAMEQRIARLALLHGDNAKAELHFTAALNKSLAMPEPPKETIAWCQWQLGETAFASGNYQKAEEYYRQSLATFPDYFRPLASLGRVTAANGSIDEAITIYEKVTRILPDPYFVAALGDLYKLAGRDQDAENQYALVEQIGHLNAVNGTLYNRQLALFYADHDLKPEDAYANAAKEYEIRRDIYGADAVAWTALKAGRIAEAQTAIKEALKLGTKDARLYYHAGMIAQAAGDAPEAVRYLQMALKQSPAFDPLQSANAKRALKGLKDTK